jgi:osmotically-inducible protein OsmY
MYKKLFLIFLCVSTLNSCITAATSLVTAAAAGATKREDFKKTISDAKIGTVIRIRFMDKGFNALYKKITTQVLFGRVFLLGYVSSQEEIDEAVHIASDTEGVIDVINELKVSDKSNYFDTKQYLIDSYITSAVKTKLFGTKDLKSFTFTVITQNNIVYLFGNVDSQEKLEEITSIVSYISGVHKVKSYIIIN